MSRWVMAMFAPDSVTAGSTQCFQVPIPLVGRTFKFSAKS